MQLITYYPNGNPYIVEYRVDGGFTLDGRRVSGKRQCKVLIYDVTGKEISILRYNDYRIEYIGYYQNGLKHNLHGPASITWHGNGQIYNILYWQNGKLHNLYGPAYISWFDNGQPVYIGYWQNGIKYNLHGCYKN